MACFHRVSFSSAHPPESVLTAFIHPFAAQRSKPPGQYCVIEYLDSPGCMVVFPCCIVPEGSRIVEPEGNWTRVFKSHNMKCPPSRWSKSPSEVTAQYPAGKLPLSVCTKHSVLGPRLNDTVGKTLRGKGRLRDASFLQTTSSESE